MKINTIFSFMALFVFAVVSTAQAQNCATPPSCASLGYTLSAPKSIGWVCTACPFDPTKFSCTKRPCPAGTTTAYRTFKIEGGCTGTNASSCARVFFVYAFSGDEPCMMNNKYIVQTGELSGSTTTTHW